MLLLALACSRNQPGEEPPPAALPPASTLNTPASGAEDRAVANTNDTAERAASPAAGSPSDRQGAVNEAARDADEAADRKDVADRDDAPATADRDNTAVNRRDRDDATKTPGDQKEGRSDLSITQQIRQNVMADDTLSFGAKNVKIITNGGRVTLRGTVDNDRERSRIEAAAKSVAGAGNVDNQIEVDK